MEFVRFHISGAAAFCSWERTEGIRYVEDFYCSSGHAYLNYDFELIKGRMLYTIVDERTTKIPSSFWLKGYEKIGKIFCFAIYDYDIHIAGDREILERILALYSDVREKGLERNTQLELIRSICLAAQI